MLHRIPSNSLGARSEVMAEAITRCVHCGFCLPTCPTYEVLGDEADSPRGRIYLIKEVLEGNLQAADAAPHIDRCLGCVACETHCPSGVPYGQLLSSYRATRQVGTSRSLMAKLRRWITAVTVPYPRRFAFAMRLGRWTRPLARLAPRGLQPLVELIPDSLPEANRPPQRSPAVGELQDEVMMHIGCAAQVLNPQITAAAIRVLNRAGVAVQVPPEQRCCGSLHWHVGHVRRATKLARRNVRAFGNRGMKIITTAAGCGSGMHEYPLVLADQRDVQQAKEFAQRVVDFSVYLNDKQLPPMTSPRPLKIAYHDACHLAHAQRVRQPPRELLERIDGVTLVDLVDSDLCCGSAGTYNIDQPVIAAELGRRKAQSVIDSGCDLVALGNIGCQVQIEQYLAKLGAASIPVLHVAQILDAVLAGRPLPERLASVESELGDATA